jgi:hypothetical protein
MHMASDRPPVAEPAAHRISAPDGEDTQLGSREDVGMVERFHQAHRLAHPVSGEQKT